MVSVSNFIGDLPPLECDLDLQEGFLFITMFSVLSLCLSEGQGMALPERQDYSEWRDST